jgi:uncharacterized protein
MHRVLSHLTLSILLLFSVAACNNNTKSSISPSITHLFGSELDAADNLAATGNFQAAATQYEALSVKAALADKPAIILKAANAWFQARRYNQASEAASKLNRFSLSPSQQLQQQLVEAEVALAFRQIDLALQLLSNPPSPSIAAEFRIKRLRIRAQGQQLNGNILEQASEIVKLDNLLINPEEKLTNQQIILQTLSMLTETALQYLQPPQSDPLAGWMELALITKTMGSESNYLQQAIQQWHEQFPSHPAEQTLIDSLLAKIQELAKPLNQVALLLPQSGKYQKAAEAFRDGFIATHYTKTNRPLIKIYDSAEADIVALYQQAVTNGASFVIGPLTKKNVRTLYFTERLPVPVLALNYVDTNSAQTYRENFYQFSLSPEDEAQQAAERAWLDGHSRAIVLSTNNSLGTRISNSFQQHWQKLGAEILETKTFENQDRDFSEPIQALLNLDESELRNKQLKVELDETLQFEPRSREDADFIFLAAKPVHGRIIRPQLQFHRAESLPIFTTSQIFTGSQHENQDKDLDGIFFCDIPWVLTSDSDKLLSKDKLLELWPNISQQFLRLYAMGIDSYQLTSQLPWLSANIGQSFDGRTGQLYLDDNLKIHRRLIWAKFKNGTPKVIGYAPQIDDSIEFSLPATLPVPDNNNSILLQ